MEATDLEKKAKVATDLFEKGAARVRISDTDIEVDWKEYTAITSGTGEKVSQVVKVDVAAVAKAEAEASSSVSAQLQEISKQLHNYDIDPKVIPKAKTQLKTLEQELNKKKPKWDTIKQVLGWTLNCSKDLFLRLTVVLVEHYIKNT